MKRTVGFLTLFTGVLAAAVTHAKDLPSYTAYAGAGVAPADRVAAASAEVARAGGIVASIDARRGVPSFLWAAGAQPAPLVAASPEAAARFHLERFAGAYGVAGRLGAATAVFPRAALDAADVVRVHDTGRGGILVVLRQRVGGIEVFRGDVKVMMRRTLELVAISGSLHPDAVPATKRAFKLQPADAVSAALQDLYGVAVPAAGLAEKNLRKEGGYRYFELPQTAAVQAQKLHFVEPARVKQVFFPMPDRLVPAYFLEIQGGKTDEVTSDVVAYVIAADDGRLLHRANLTHQDAFDYRVWAETTGDGRPLDGPQADHTPHPTGIPDGSEGAFIPPVLISMEGFNTNPAGGVDPWLAATAVQSLGNNVDAYADLNAPDGFSNNDLRATTTAAGTFDRVYDVALDPASSQDQSMAAATQLFYVNNWLHDWYYDSGFNEAAGNAQQNNFGRGGLGADVLRAEAQDGAFAGNRNNANMSTPADGASPRMQMYLWSTPDLVRSLLLQPSGTSLTSGVAGFGPLNFNVTGPVVLVDDGAGASSTDGCEAPTNNVAGQIVLIDRGSCSFKLKTLNVETAGAIGVIIANNIAGASPPTMGNDASLPQTTIPSLSITFEDGGALKTDLQAGPVTATLERQIDVERDGTIDNTIVAHEWGHYLHHRLSDCGTKMCGALSEGWADFVALHLALREGDDLDGVFALAIYSTKVFGDNGYYGIRRAPYSLDPTKNEFTFKHITDGEPIPTTFPSVPAGNTNSEVHNAGEIWTSMLFEAYAKMLKASAGPTPPYTFEEARRRMSDYIVAGLQLAPAEATFTETRDAILAAAYARDPGDMILLADGFARRGAGSCAESPDRFSQDFVGVVEGFVLQPKIEIVSAALDDGVTTCDGDGILDARETGQIVVQVRNGGVAPLLGTQATVSSATSGVSFPAGPTVTLGDIGPFETVTVKMDVALDETFDQIADLDLTVEVMNPDACAATVSHLLVPRINFDDVAGVSATDDVESEHVVWTKAGDNADTIWARPETSTAPTNHVWHGTDFSSTSDTQLESPDLMVSPTDPFIITFDHAYEFEADATDNYDGGLIEISDDDGSTWTDISTYADPGYTGAITTNSNNPLGGTQAFVGPSAAWPNMEPVTLDLGTALAGKTVRLRFRIATDGGVGAFGWALDNLNFAGITNTPFGELQADSAMCQDAPVADAGPDQTVESGDEVTLDATASSDPNGDTLKFAWTQVAGPQVSLSGGATVMPAFLAPVVDEDTTLTFQVAVSDDVAVSNDTVDIVVTPRTDGTGGSGATGGGLGDATPDGDCGCTVVGSDAGGAAGIPMLALAAMLAGRRRRR